MESSTKNYITYLMGVHQETIDMKIPEKLNLVEIIIIFSDNSDNSTS